MSRSTGIYLALLLYFPVATFREIAVHALLNVSNLQNEIYVYLAE